ncbi:MAG: NfeD-like protein [Oscillospiraceae bacterium]|nr:NfeD-like protein [Oscillospiraceae bacterium]
MTEWWESLSALVRVLYCIAVPSTLLLLLQTILSISGFGGDSDVNISDTSGIDMGDISGADFGDVGDIGDIGDLGDVSDLSADVPDTDIHVHGSYSSLQLFTVQGIVAFLAVSGWVSIAALSSGVPSAGAIPLGLVAGFFAMYGIAKLVQISKKLTENGTIDFRNAIGENATVYIPIPPAGEGEGKVTLTLQGRFMECSAVSNEREMLKTGTAVRVTDLNGEVLVVERE